MRIVLSSIAALILLLSACASEESSASPTEQPQSELGEQLPFDAVLFEFFGTDDLDSYLVAIDATSSELVAACMREAGFDFTLPAPADPTAPAPERETLAYARDQGFGLISGFRKSITATELPAGDINDVNLDYLRSLTSDELAAFFVALDGRPAEPGQLQTDRGCNGSAGDVTYADWQRFNEALPQHTGMAEERDSHPDWLATRADWRTCMIERGFDYAEPDAIRTDVASRIEQLLLGDNEQLVIESEAGVILDPAIDALLDETMEFEREAAVANFECTAPLQARFDVVERQVQQGFVDRNRVTIDELLQAP